MPAKKKFQDFESAIERLEEITGILETGEESLEESIKLYTEGLQIAQYCQKKLTEAESKIKIIQKNDGQFTEGDFDKGTVEE